MRAKRKRQSAVKYSQGEPELGQGNKVGGGERSNALPYGSFLPKNCPKQQFVVDVVIGAKRWGYFWVKPVS